MFLENKQVRGLEAVYRKKESTNEILKKINPKLNNLHTFCSSRNWRERFLILQYTAALCKTSLVIQIMEEALSFTVSITQQPFLTQTPVISRKGQASVQMPTDWLSFGF